MDQGIAAAFAGVVGLIGAGIGGLATAYGARIGANKTIEAAQTQVMHQSAAEHTHWVREQRRQICNDVMEAWTPLIEASVICTVRIRRGVSVPDDAVGALDSSFVNLSHRGARSQLWGPDELVNAIQDLVTAARSVADSARRWPQVLDGREQAAIQAHQTEHAAKASQVASAWRSFASVARATLRSPS